jgi:hypothetical protein
VLINDSDFVSLSLIAFCSPAGSFFCAADSSSFLGLGFGAGFSSSLS